MVQNTIFVFVVDHGAPMDNTYDISLDYKLCTLTILCPKIIKEPKNV